MQAIHNQGIMKTFFRWNVFSNWLQKINKRVLSGKLTPSYNRSLVKESLLINKKVGSILLGSFDSGTLPRLPQSHTELRESIKDKLFKQSTTIKFLNSAYSIP